MTKLFVYFSILMSTLFLSISIIKDYTAQKYFSKFENVLEGDSQNIKKQKFYLKKALEFSPSNADTLFELGRLYIKEKLKSTSLEDKNRSYGQAIEFLNKALIRKPADGNNYARYGWYIGDNGETNEALEYFEKAVKLGKTRAYIHCQYARWCVNLVKREVNLNNIHQFEGVYKNEQKKSDILKSYDDRFINGVSLAVFLEKAQMEWDKAWALGLRASWYQVAYNSKADLNLIRCEIDEAINNYGRAHNKIMLAKCYYIKEDYNKTISVLASIIKEVGPYFWRYKVQTEKLLNEVINHDPENYLAFNWLGEMCTRLGRNKHAIANLKIAVTLNPTYADAHLKLGKLYKLTGQSELAIKEYEIVLSLVSNHKEATFLLSEAIREK